ncbi:MAG: hypothetical protein HOK81_06035, partial [Rhodospirillaceae bacterium]|nr:hypothetical protein [Rhodospirillaceae bacterium]
MPADRGYQDDHDPRSFESGPSRRIRIAAWTVALVALGAFGIVIWYAYNLGIRDGTESVAPLIRADARPTKIKPEKPGGMAVPHQDKEIYETLGSGGNTEPKVERLLPPPEQPKALPSPAPPAQAPSAPSSTSGGDQARGDQASGDQGGAPAPSDQLRALMEREGLTVEAEGAKTGAEKDRPTPPKADVATAPPPPPKQAPAATTPPAPPAAAPAPAAPTQTATTADMAGR